MLKQLDGLRGPLCIGVIAINMGLYNAGANLPVGVFLVLSGLTSFVAYGECTWDDVSRAKFFRRRLVRLLPMLLVSTVFQCVVTLPWLVRPGVQVDAPPPLGSSGGYFTAVTNTATLLLIVAGAGALCRGTACGCCQIDHWPRPACALLPLILGAYLHGTGWYVGLVLLLNAYFLPKLLARYGESWCAAPPSCAQLGGWALLEALQYALPLFAFAATRSTDIWYYATVYVYMGGPPLFRLNTFIYGIHVGRWSSFISRGGGNGEARALTEARTLLPAVAITIFVVTMNGFLTTETQMHRPDTGATSLQWAVIHMLHPFTELSLICGLVRAPQSLLARILASPPLAKLAELSYAMYLLHVGVIMLYTFVCDKRWIGESEMLQASEGATALNAYDYGATVFLSITLAYPVTRWIEPRVAVWFKARVEPSVRPEDTDLL